MRGVVFSCSGMRPATWFAVRPSHGMNVSLSVRNGPCAAMCLTTPALPAAATAEVVRHRESTPASRAGVTSASRRAPAAARPARIALTSRNSASRLVIFIGLAVVPPTGTARLILECRNSFAVRR